MTPRIYWKQLFTRCLINVGGRLLRWYRCCGACWLVSPRRVSAPPQGERVTVTRGPTRKEKCNSTWRDRVLTHGDTLTLSTVRYASQPGNLSGPSASASPQDLITHQNPRRPALARGGAAFIFLYFFFLPLKGYTVCVPHLSFLKQLNILCVLVYSYIFSSLKNAASYLMFCFSTFQN